ncbi:MAG: thrombospondin type 3 repeat-containing protein [bacterium]
MKAMKWIVMCCAAFACVARGGLPEPGFTMYGVIRNDLNGANVRVTSGTLRWTIVPDGGTPLTLETRLENIHDQFSYALDVPLESPAPGMPSRADALQLTAGTVQYGRAQVYVESTVASIVAPATALFSLSQTDRGKFERVDLQVNIAFADSDHDGLPDFWETEHFGGLFAAPGGDADGDGVSNMAEYLAGTNPQDAQSMFEFIETETWAEGGTRIRWQSSSNRFYSLFKSRDLRSGFEPFVTGIRATPPENSYTDTNAVGEGAYFYRIVVE